MDCRLCVKQYPVFGPDSSPHPSLLTGDMTDRCGVPGNQFELELEFELVCLCEAR